MKKQGHDRTAIAERVKAARRAAALRREAEERVEKQEAERKLDEGEPMTVNDMLAMLGSAFRLPEPDPPDPLTLLKKAWEDGELETAHAKEIKTQLAMREHGGLAPAYEAGAVDGEDVDREFKKVSKKRGKTPEYDFTAEEITRLRDEVGLSWRQVAVNLELGSPGAARKAYTVLTGKDYRDSEMTGRRARSTLGSSRMSTRKVYAPDWNDDSDQDEIIERLGGARIIAERNVKGIKLEEDIIIGRVVRLHWDGPGDDGPLTVDFIDRTSGGQRSIRVTDIKEVR